MAVLPVCWFPFNEAVGLLGQNCKSSLLNLGLIGGVDMFVTKVNKQGDKLNLSFCLVFVIQWISVLKQKWALPTLSLKGDVPNIYNKM